MNLFQYFNVVYVKVERNSDARRTFVGCRPNNCVRVVIYIRMNMYFREISTNNRVTNRIEMYLDSSREKILKYILLATGMISVTSSLYLSFGIYFSILGSSFIAGTFKIDHLILVSGYFGLTLFSGLNKSFFKRKIYSEFIVVPVIGQ